MHSVFNSFRGVFTILIRLMAFVFAAAALLALPCGAHACPDHAAVVQAVSASWQGEPASVGSLASRGGRSGRMFRSGARSALHRSPLLRDAARGARARVPDCVLRLRPPARHRFPSRRHERHPRQGLSASESLKLRALRLTSLSSLSSLKMRNRRSPAASQKAVLCLA